MAEAGTKGTWARMSFGVGGGIGALTSHSFIHLTSVSGSTLGIGVPPTDTLVPAPTKVPLWLGVTNARQEGVSLAGGWGGGIGEAAVGRLHELVHSHISAY